MDDRLADRRTGDHRTTGAWTARLRPLSSVFRGPISCRLASKTFRDRRGTFKAGPGPEHGDGRAAAPDQGPPGGPRAFDRYGLDTRHQLFQRHRPSPGEHLARDLLG